jgi:hypothetical protein
VVEGRWEIKKCVGSSRTECEALDEKATVPREGCTMPSLSDQLSTVAPSSESITRLNLVNYTHSSKSQLSYFGIKLSVFNSD